MLERVKYFCFHLKGRCIGGPSGVANGGTADSKGRQIEYFMVHVNVVDSRLQIVRDFGLPSRCRSLPSSDMLGGVAHERTPRPPIEFDLTSGPGSLVLLVLPYIAVVLYQDVWRVTYNEDNCYCRFRTSRPMVWVPKTARQFILWFRLLQILWDPTAVRIPRHRIIIGPVSVSFLCSSFF